MTKAIAIVLLVSALFVLSSFAPAFSQEAGELFASATRAYEQADFAGALDLFEHARDAGMEGPAIHYNIAVCQYELGRYGEAEATFRLIADNYPRMRALAEYNVGLTLLRQNRNEAAIEHFQYARDNSGDDKIVRFADIALRRLDLSGGPDRVQGVSWAGVLDLAVGYDENVALIDEATIPTGQTADSPFMELFSVFSGPLTSAPGFRFDGSLYAVNYDDASEYDQTALRLGAFYHWRRDDWQYEIGPYMNRSTLGGDGFEQRLGASVMLRRLVGSSSRVGLRLAHDEVDEISSRFAFVSGSREQLTFSWDRFGSNGRLTFEYQLETNDRLDAGVSPSRHRLRIRYRLEINPDLRLDTSISRRNSTYDDVLQRSENLSEGSLGFVRNLRGGWELRGTYLWSDNQSTVSQFSYSRNRTTFGITKNFDR